MTHVLRDENIGEVQLLRYQSVAVSHIVKFVLTFVAVVGYVLSTFSGVIEIAESADEGFGISAGFAAVLYSIVEIVYVFMRKKWFSKTMPRSVLTELILVVVSVGVSFLLGMTGILSVIFKIVWISGCVIYLCFMLELFVSSFDILQGITKPSFERQAKSEHMAHQRREMYHEGSSEHFYIKKDGRWTYVYIDKEYANDSDVIHSAETAAAVSGANPNYTTVKYY